MTTAVEHYVAARSELMLPGAGLDWLDELRDTGVRRFSEEGFPTLRDENWRYTNIRPILKRNFTPVPALGERVGQEEELSPHLLPELGVHRFVFVNGYYSRELSGTGAVPVGVTAMPMAHAVARGLKGAKTWLGRCIPEDIGGFTALNTAFIEDGLYLEVDPNRRLQHPIELVFIGTAPGGQLIQPRNLLVFGENSQARVIERYVSGDAGTHLTNAVTELAAGDSSVVEHTRMQEEGKDAFHVGGVFVMLDRGARVVSNNIALGSRIARTDLQVELRGQGATCDLNGVYLGSGRQHIDNFTQVDHRVPECKSNEYYKGVMNDRARAVFHGRVIVREGAQHTDAQQQNRNLLLSAHAEVDTKPQLEIYADDVKCSHGATIGQLDDAAMFYLRSRGIDETTARSLLTYAFAADVINRVTSEAVRDHLEGILGRKMFDVERLEEFV